MQSFPLINPALNAPSELDAHSITGLLSGTWHDGHGTAPCPVCQPERRFDRDGLSLSNCGDELLVYCQRSGCAFSEIIRSINLLKGSNIGDLSFRTKKGCKTSYVTSEWFQSARKIWQRSIPVTGTGAEAYLRGCGITVPIPNSLRFSPFSHLLPSGERYRALVADIQPLGGIHQIFITAQGKRIVKNATSTMGMGDAVHLSKGSGPLVVAKDIETGLSLVQMLSDLSPTVWAVLFNRGMMTLDLPRKPQELIIAVDGDPVSREDARVLESRAIHFGWKVSRMDPGDGLTFNDVLMKRGAL